jgi:hypothetical protein
MPITGHESEYMENDVTTVWFRGPMPQFTGTPGDPKTQRGTVPDVCFEGRWFEDCCGGPCNECRRVEVSEDLPDGVPSNWDTPRAEPRTVSEELVSRVAKKIAAVWEARRDRACRNRG